MSTLVIQYINIRPKTVSVLFYFGMSEYLEKNITKMRCFCSRSIVFERLHRQALLDVGVKPPDVEVEPKEPGGTQRTISM